VVAWPVRLVARQRQAVLIPSGFVRKVFGSTVMYDPIHEEYMSSHSATGRGAERQPAASCGGHAGRFRQGRVVVRATNYRLTIAGVPGGSADLSAPRTDIQSFDNPRAFTQ